MSCVLFCYYWVYKRSTKLSWTQLCVLCTVLLLLGPQEVNLTVLDPATCLVYCSVVTGSARGRLNCPRPSYVSCVLQTCIEQMCVCVGNANIDKTRYNVVDLVANEWVFICFRLSAAMYTFLLMGLSMFKLSAAR